MAMTEEDFMEAVEEGLKLSKRLYFGKDRSVSPPKPPPPMSKFPRFYLPTAPMVYAVISDPGIVDNPDIPSYQPYVYGRCDPPALIPLQMNNVSLEVDCYLDTVFVKVTGQWRVHCVMGSKACDCRLAVPMGEQGSILGVEVDVPRKSYRTQIVPAEDEMEKEKASGTDDGALLSPDIFFLTIPQVDGGSNISITINWSQKLLYHDGEFSLCVPFNFPEYVTPASKKVPRRQKIQLNVHPSDGSEVLCKTISHPLKERKRQVDCLSFLYESDVLTWSNTDFSFSYNVPTNQITGSVLLQSPSIDDTDQREMFCLHLFSGNQQGKKAFSRSIVYVVDISSSMQGRPLEATKKSLFAALSELNPEDSFNIIAFNGDIFPFSSSMMLASQETIERATQWMDDNLTVGDGTNISLALEKAMDMLSDTQNSLPIVFLITDGAVDDERRICNAAKSRLSNMKSISPRINTFGIGLYCNHYFLRMLAMIGHGHYDAAFSTDSIEPRLQKLITRASSIAFTNVTFDKLDELDNAEVYLMNVPDLSSESPLTISGRYSGNFPEVLKARGLLADMTSYEMDLKVRRAKAIPLDKILAMQQIIMCTSQAWLLEDKQLASKVATVSVQSGIISEYTSMALLVTETLKKETKEVDKQPKQRNRKDRPRAPETKSFEKYWYRVWKREGNRGNIPPGFNEPRPPEAAEVIVKAASDCCTRMWDTAA
ncbi:Inter-alpha-trypsin inhibitor heavy chain H4, partial [Bienertia sinuspersici]